MSSVATAPRFLFLRLTFVSIRSKLLLILFAAGIVPMLLLNVANYFNGVRAVEQVLREDADSAAARIAHNVEELLHARESNLVGLAQTGALAEYVRASVPPTAAPSPSASLMRAGRPLPDGVRAEVKAFFGGYQNYYESLICLDRNGRPLFRATRERAADGGSASVAGEVVFQTTDFVTSSVRYDDLVLGVSAPVALRSGITPEPYGAAVRATVPVFVEGEAAPYGAVVAEINLDELCGEVSRGYISPDAPVAGVAARQVFVLDRTGRYVFHTSDALKHQLVTVQTPTLVPIAQRMTAGEGGLDFYETRSGERWLAAYHPAARGELSVAVTRDYGNAMAEVKGTGLFGIILSLIAALTATVLLTVVARRAARRIERVAAGAAAIAKGDLDQRINIRSGDEIRGLAESFNLMTDRLREHIVREAETRQFESFTRLSAMLTHDLKNAITGLSMLVQNLDRHFDDERFRADAIHSLREATDKLRRIVARLTEPAKSLSGEYKRDIKPTDLIPIIKHVLATTAEPARPLYEIETTLPESLVATVEPERMTNVIENLVINAMEAMGARGGRLTVEAGHDAEGRIFFSVVDTGIGMSDDFLRMRLFRAFNTTKARGIGLGLYTCREIVEAHGGRLDVESKLNVGTRFCVVLPSLPFTSSRGGRSGGHREQTRHTPAMTGERGA